MIEGLISPILASIPQPLQVPLRAAIPGDVVGQAQELHAHIGQAVSGMAGQAAATAIAQASQDVERTIHASGLLEQLEQHAGVAVREAIQDVAVIAQDCARQLAQAAAGALMTGMNPMGLGTVLLPIAQEGYAHAHARLEQLEMELNGLAGEVERVDIPQQVAQPPTPVSSAEPASSEVNHAPGSSMQANAAVAAAKSALGTPYQWGGNTPGVGLDCSGLTQWAYKQAGVEIPRTADAQAVGPAIPRSQVQPGDLAVWDGHVAMVVDGNNFIEAGDPVQISPIRETNMGMGFKGFYRPTAA